MPDDNLDNPKAKMRIAMSILQIIFRQKEVNNKSNTMKVIKEMIRLLEGEVKNES